MSGVGSAWSRRRAAVAAEAAEHDALIQTEQAAVAEKSDEEILEDLGLPDPDTLIMGDDFKAFMGKAVPQHLRKRALRTLWRSNPVLACVDGLNDYDDDYLTAGIGQGTIKTTYQVGKGMLAHLLEIERQNAAAETEVVETEPQIDEDAFDAVDAADTTALAAPATPVDEPSQSMLPRRMQFQFRDQTA